MTHSLGAGGENFCGFAAFLQPQNRLHVDDNPLQGEGQTVKQFVLRDDLQP
jgi:hypothetical protein